MSWRGFIWIFAWTVAIAALLWGVSLCAVRAHDSWISRGGHRNGAGEYCCGEGDCFVIPAPQVRSVAAGYQIVVLPKQGSGENARAELVPSAEAQPSPDGAFWRCRRPDGSRRCFFAPPPNT
jgi:hypothetical protein